MCMSREERVQRRGGREGVGERGSEREREGEGEGEREGEGEVEGEGERERGREREWERERERGEGGGETGRGGEVTLLTLGCGWWGGLRNLFNLHRGVHLRWERKLDFLSIFPIVVCTYSAADSAAKSRHDTHPRHPNAK